MMTIPLDIRYGIDNENPYNVIDGKWGGFGPPAWFVFKQLHPRNVWERGYMDKNITWCRVWDDDAQCWRNITDDEQKILPTLEAKIRYPRGVIDRWESLLKRGVHMQFPIIKMQTEDLITPDIINVQPMCDPINSEKEQK